MQLPELTSHGEETSISNSLKHLRMMMDKQRLPPNIIPAKLKSAERVLTKHREKCPRVSPRALHFNCSLNTTTKYIAFLSPSPHLCHR